MKFFNLLKKELKELITIQMIATLVLISGVFVIMGQTFGNIQEDIQEASTKINLCDQDNTDFSKGVIETIKSTGSTVNLVEANTEDRAALLKELEIENLIIIPQGFTETIFNDKQTAELEVINVMKSVSSISQLGSISTTSAVEIIKSSVTQTLMHADYDLTADEIALLEHPISQRDVTVVDTKSSNVGSSTLLSFISLQNMLFPIIIFLLISQGTQMIVSSMSTEKIDKTLETLLSTPVSRLSVIGAKMLSAAIMALINAVVMMVSYTSFSSQLVGDTSKENISSITGEVISVSAAMSHLGLTLSLSNYLSIGLQMFMSLLIALSLAMILGAMVDNAKAAQAALLPITGAAMIPYIISMITDVNTLPKSFQILINAIPFTHTYTASSNIMFNNMGAYWGGFIYQAIFLMVSMFILLKLFTSDKLFTISLNFGQKNKFNKANKKGLFSK